MIDRLTIREAASSTESLKLVLIGVGETLPVVAGYAEFSCRVFRGKIIELHHV